MTNRKLYSKLTPVVLIVALFCSACDVPDLSEFTKQSAEMTRGIRTGVRNTETLIKTASEKEDLYSEATRKKLKQNLKEYQNGMKPTVEALDALDAYLEALNALSQANKKSEENSRAAVTAVGNLVTAVSGLTFATSAVNVAAGLLTMAEEFRTAKDFKKRVNLASEIVEGVHLSRDEDGKPIKDDKGQPVFLRTCTDAAGDQIVETALRIKKIVDPILASLAEAQTKTLKPLSPEKKREKLREWGKLSQNDFSRVRAAEQQIADYHCGVIDLIKFNIKDLKEINQIVSKSMATNIREKDVTVFGLYTNLRVAKANLWDEKENILVVKNLIPRINELVINQANPETIVTRKVRLKTTLDNLFMLDAPLKTRVIEAIRTCGAACGRMLEVLRAPVALNCDAACLGTLKTAFRVGIKPWQFERSAGVIITELDTRMDELTDQEKRYAADVERLKPDFDAVTAELKLVDDKKDQLDSLLTTSLSALNAWSEAHANLRVAVNTKRRLNVSKLESKVREIWGIIHPAAG